MISEFCHIQEYGCWKHRISASADRATHNQIDSISNDERRHSIAIDVWSCITFLVALHCLPGAAICYLSNAGYNDPAVKLGWGSVCDL
jgi:hypothetical protein